MNLKSESFLNEMFELVAVGIAQVSLDGKFLEVNPKLCELSGYSRAELLALNFQDVTHEDDREASAQRIRRVLEGEIENYSIEKRYVHKNGQDVWVNLTVSLVRSPLGQPRFFVGIVNDISEPKTLQIQKQKAHSALEKKVEDRTRELEHTRLQLDRFFTMAPDLFAIADTDGYFRVVNDAFIKATGYSKEELTSQPFMNFVHPDDRVPTATVAAELDDGIPALNFQNRYVTRSGQTRWFSWRALPIPAEGVIYAAARDVTELKAKEEVIEEQRSQMIEASRLHSLGQMAAGIAHEINNPLSVLYLNTIRLKELNAANELSSEEAQRLIAKMEEMTWRMTSIVKGLKSFGRDGAADPVEAVNVKDLLETSVSLVEGYCRQHQVELSVENFSDQLHVSGRTVQLSQVLVNLFTNAVDSVSGTGNAWISVKVSVDEQKLEIKVSDSGEKLPEKLIAKLFEPFFTTKAVGRGTGLGLSISIGLAQANNGNLYYDRSSATAAFVLQLPLLT